jgi:hypothetical protein
MLMWGRYTGLKQSVKSLGFDSTDLVGLLSGFSEELEDPKMKSYKTISENEGLDMAFLDFLQRSNEMKPDKCSVSWGATTCSKRPSLPRR